MAKEMWFGTRGFMRWVPCPAINYDASQTGYSQVLNYLNGGAATVSSMTGSKGYNLSWAMVSRESGRMITDYAAGVYGEPLMYWADPFAMDTNLLPQHWATPSLMGYDAPLLCGVNKPALVNTPANSNFYPAQSAVVTMVPMENPQELYIPIPPGYTLHFGANGTGDAVYEIAPASGVSTGVFVRPALLSVTSTTRFNHSITSAQGDGAVIRFAPTGSATVSGAMAQLLPTGVTPPTGGFISGQGHSGCTFASKPVLTQYSAALDKVGVVINLVETRAWDYISVPAV